MRRGRSGRSWCAARCAAAAAGLVAAVAAAAVAVAAAVLLIPPQSGLHRGDEVRIAQRLDFFEDLAVLQNREALEDIEVVSELHTLEVRP